jgi:hypothetical protein
MKKVLLPLLMLIAIAGLLAVESAPSSIVGYVKYPCVTGLNFVALPMESGYAYASDAANAFPGMMDALSQWDAATQTWVIASDLGGFFDGDFPVAPGMPLMINALDDFNFYSMGSVPTNRYSYDLLTGLNAIMVPLSRTNLTLASEVGMDIGVVDAVSAWDAPTQTWVIASDLGGFYDGDYSVTIGMPLMVNALEPITWSGAKSVNKVKTLKASRASK